jgi:cobalt-zinc-cadmium efflux system protein
MRAYDGVTDVHDLHVWEIGSGFPALAAHVLVARDRDCLGIRRGLEGLLHDRFHLDHTTLQVEHTADRLLWPTR